MAAAPLFAQDAPPVDRPAPHASLKVSFPRPPGRAEERRERRPSISTRRIIRHYRSANLRSTLSTANALLTVLAAFVSMPPLRRCTSSFVMLSTGFCPTLGTRWTRSNTSFAAMPLGFCRFARACQARRSTPASLEWSPRLADLVEGDERPTPRALAAARRGLTGDGLERPSFEEPFEPERSEGKVSEDPSDPASPVTRQLDQDPSPAAAATTARSRS
jgi:hypothetical protein